MKKVVVTGMGFATSLGWNRALVLDSLRGMRTGIEAWDPMPGTPLPITVAGTVKGFDTSSPEASAWTFPDGHVPDSSFLRQLPPHGAYALWAVEQMLTNCGLEKSAIQNGETGLYCASSGSPIVLKKRLDELSRSSYRRAHPLGVVTSISGLLNFHFSAYLGVKGPSCGFVSACASGSHALGYGSDEIAMGRAQRMIILAGEALTPETVIPFHGMGALSRETSPALASCPFDQKRNGFVASGGAVAILLEEESLARERGADILARVSGWGQATDGFHCAMPDPSGQGLARAMRLALASAGMNAGEIDYINAHATSTPAGDLAEILAIKSVFGSNRPAISSTKALTGHPLALSGVLESTLCILAMREKFLPGQAHLANPMAEAAELHIPRENLESAPRAVLSNTSGFGGANVSIVLSHA